MPPESSPANSPAFDPPPPGAEQAAWLETEEGSRFLLQGNCRLGRWPDNQIVIDGQKASRRHAIIHAQDEDEFWIIDLASRNGTYLNDHRVLRPTRLRPGDRLHIGDGRFVFHQPFLSTHKAGSDTVTNAGIATVVEFKEEPVWLLIADMESFVQLSREWPADRLAVSTGRWFQDSQRLIGQRGGRFVKYLGDGFLACWPAGATPDEVAGGLRDMHALREQGEVKFRVVIHYGVVTFGGASSGLGEESMIGPELNFTFRLEKLASRLGVTFALSEAAHALLAGVLPTTLVAGEHELKGFPGQHRCFEVTFAP